MIVIIATIMQVVENFREIWKRNKDIFVQIWLLYLRAVLLLMFMMCLWCVMDTSSGTRIADLNTALIHNYATYSAI